MTEADLKERIIPDGESGVEWSNTGSLARLDFFIVTWEIYALEEQYNLDHNHIRPRSVNWSRRFEYPWCLLNSELDDQDIVLDAGGGESSMTAYIVSKIKGKTLTGEGLRVPPEVHNLDLFDWRDGVLNDQKELKKRAGWTWYYPRQGDLRWPPYPVETFDKIFCISVIEHMLPKDRMESIKTLLSLLKPSGILLLTIDVHKDRSIGFLLKEAEAVAKLFGLKLPPKPPDILRSNTTETGLRIARQCGEKPDDPTEILCFKVVKSRLGYGGLDKKSKKV